MLQIETLRKQETDGGMEQYEEPDGEYVDFIGSGSNTISVLTRVDSEKGAGQSPAVESPPIDPTVMTVSDLEDALENKDYDWNLPALRGLRKAEKDGKNRTTAVDAIEEKMENISS